MAHIHIKELLGSPFLPVAYPIDGAHPFQRNNISADPSRHDGCTIKPRVQQARPPKQWWLVTNIRCDPRITALGRLVTLLQLLRRIFSNFPHHLHWHSTCANSSTHTLSAKPITKKIEITDGILPTDILLSVNLNYRRILPTDSQILITDGFFRR